MSNIYFFDIDNTLLDHDTREIPQSALDAIQALHPAGHTVVIATGRSYEHAKPFIDLVRPSYAITLNGARIFEGEREVFKAALDASALTDLFDWITALGHHFGANHGGIGYVSADVPSTTTPLRSVGIVADPEHVRNVAEDIGQAWLFFDESLDATLRPAIRERYPQFDTVRWHRTALDVMPKAINKWTGCRWVLARTGFLAEHAIAFGDGLNDMEMLQGVGLGVAMGNGHPELKAIANRIAPALHLDGIATVLNELAEHPPLGRGD